MYEVHGGAQGLIDAPENGAPDPGGKARTLARARHAMLSDDGLAKQAAAGDRGAFEAIFRRYQDDLYRFCVGILREPQDAQDAVQNTMIKAMRALPGERREMQLKPWLYRVAHNEAIELRRRERPVDQLVETVDDVTAGTEEQAEHNGRLQKLLADIADLPERQRASLVMRELNGLGFGEIGAALGTSPGAVRQALYEARRGLAEMDHGRDMKCDLATRMVSDAEGRPRDRGVRAHLRDCSPCRRFQAEIRARSRTFAAISPLPVIVAAGALKAALGGTGMAGGGAGAATVAGGGGAGAGVTGVGVLGGSAGASALLKPAVGLLAVLAIGTATVDHGAIFGADRAGPSTARHAESTHSAAEPLGRHAPSPNRRVAVRTGKRAVGARAGAGQASRPGGNAPVGRASGVAAQPADAASGVAAATVGGRPDVKTLRATDRTPAAVPVVTGRSGTAALAADRPQDSAGGDPTHPEHPEHPEHPGVAKAPADVPPGQAKKESPPPGQAKKEVVPPGQSKKEAVPPGQAKKESPPPGQAKKEAQTASSPATGESSSSPATPPETPASGPPGQVKKEVQAVVETVTTGTGSVIGPVVDGPKPPGQVKKEEAATE